MHSESRERADPGAISGQCPPQPRGILCPTFLRRFYDIRPVAANCSSQTVVPPLGPGVFPKFDTANRNFKPSSIDWAIFIDEMFPPPKLVTSKLFISSSDFQNQKSQNFSKHTSPSFRNRYSGVTLLRGSRDMARYMKQVQRKSQKRYSRVTTSLPI